MNATGQAGTTPALLETLREKARILRIHSLRMTTAAGSGHPTSSMSSATLIHYCPPHPPYPVTSYATPLISYINYRFPPRLIIICIKDKQKPVALVFCLVLSNLASSSTI